MIRMLTITSVCVSLCACAPTRLGVDNPVSRSAGTPTVHLPDFERIALPNGAVLLLAPKRDVPLVAMHAMVRGGAVTDAPPKAGLASLTAALLEKGAGARDATQFVDSVAAVGGALSASAGLEAVQIGAEFLSQDVALMIELVADMLKAPHLDPVEFDKLRTRSIEFIRSARDSDPRPLIGVYGNAFLFGEHPYGTPPSGSESSLARLTPDDVLTHYAEHYGADRLIISVVGDFEPDSVRRLLRDAFGDWRVARAPQLPIPAPAAVAGGRVLLVDKPDATQTYFWLGQLGVARDYPQRAALDIANTIFGGRFTSMLNTALRIDSGLSYGAGSQLVRPTRPGSVAIVSYTATESTEEALDLALATLSALRSKAPDAALLASAKSYINGQTPLDLETAAQVSGQLAMLEFYQLDRAYVDGHTLQIEQASAAEVARVIDEVYPPAEDLVMVLVGNADAIRAQVAKFGAITEVSITDDTFVGR